MRQISFWARTHVVSARVIVTIGKIVLFILACYIGSQFFKLDIVLPTRSLYILFGTVAAIAAFNYPQSGPGLRKISFVKQKTCDLLISLSSFMIILTMANNGDIRTASEPASASINVEHPSKAMEILNAVKYGNKTALTHTEKRILRKELFHQLKVMVKAKVSGDKQKADEAGKIVLAILVALLLLVGLTALVCSISCGGADFLAIIVGVAGLVGIIWLLARTIKRIKRNG
jgi:hypothetical protein